MILDRSTNRGESTTLAAASSETGSLVCLPKWRNDRALFKIRGGWDRYLSDIGVLTLISARFHNVSP